MPDYAFLIGNIEIHFNDLFFLKYSFQDDILKNFQKLDALDIIPNAEQFECIICYLDIEPGDGVVLRECLHTFCK